MKKHFVEFYSPGTFVTENSVLPIDSWDVPTACEMAHSVKERYGATPFGFRFITRARGDGDLDSKRVDSSNLYYLGGEVFTLEQIEARNDPSDAILISNMKGNRIARVLVNTNSYRFTSGLEDSDVVLNWTPRLAATLA